MSTDVAVAPSSIETLKQRLDDPKVAEALNNLLDHADLLAIMLVGLDSFVSRSETIGEALVDGIADLRAEAAHAKAELVPAELLEGLLALAKVLPTVSTALTRVAREGVLEHLLDSGIASHAMVDQISRLGRGLVNGAERAQVDPVEVTGPVSLLKLLRDPDIQRTINYLAAVAKSIGQELKAPLPSQLEGN